MPLLATPDGNQQIDRDQLQFPGQEEQQEILGEKDQALGGGLQQHQAEIQPGFALNVPAGGHRKQGDQSREHNQGGRQAVCCQRPFQAEGRNPADPLHKLQATLAAIEMPAEGHQHQHQVGQEDGQGKGAGTPWIGAIAGQ